MIFTPVTELESRIKILQEKMNKLEISAALVLQNVDLYYYTGEAGPDCLFVPTEGLPIFFSRRRGELPSLPWHVRSIKKWDEMKNICREYGINDLPLIGIEGDVLPAALYLKMKSIFVNSSFKDISLVIRAQRAIKSSWELAIIRDTAQKDLIVWRAIPQLIEDSSTDFELAGLIESEFRKRGHTGLLRCRGFNLEMSPSLTITGKESAVPTLNEVPLSGLGTGRYFPFGASGVALEEGNTVVVDCGTCYFGYYIDQTRTYAIGRPKPKIKQAYDTCISVQSLIETTAKPGLSCGELYKMAVELVAESGSAEGFMGSSGGVRFIGHGVGLEVDELPIISKASNELLKEGMVFALEPKFAFPEIGSVGIENCYEVTANGVSKITLLSDDLVII